MNKNMKIVAALVAVVIVVAAALMLTSSMWMHTPSDANPAAKVTSEGDVSRTIDDVGSDISGISNSLNQIDSTLSDSNA
jgi:hypothetical protein